MHILRVDELADKGHLQMSEDCLYMGIIRPANVTQTNLPVMVSSRDVSFGKA